MAIRTVLVSAGSTEESQVLLKSAFHLAKDLAAHLHVLHVRADPRETIPLLGEGMSVGMIDDMTRIAEDECNKRAQRARAQYDECVATFSAPVNDNPAAQGFSVSWIEAGGREDEVLAQYGRLVDLIIVARPNVEAEVGRTLILNAALFDSGRPALVIPPGGTQKIGKRVVVSWNGSAQSARAVSSALPVLKAADEVSIFTIESQKTAGHPSAGMAEYMAYHGIDCSIRTLSGSGTSVGEALLKEVETIGADLIVMGAYTHSRMRQLILGGVTRCVLEKANVPLFMAH